MFSLVEAVAVQPRRKVMAFTWNKMPCFEERHDRRSPGLERTTATDKRGPQRGSAVEIPPVFVAWASG